MSSTASRARISSRQIHFGVFLEGMIVPPRRLFPLRACGFGCRPNRYRRFARGARQPSAQLARKRLAFQQQVQVRLELLHARLAVERHPPVAVDVEALRDVGNELLVQVVPVD